MVFILCFFTVYFPFTLLQTDSVEVLCTAQHYLLFIIKCIKIRDISLGLIKCHSIERKGELLCLPPVQISPLLDLDADEC